MARNDDYILSFGSPADLTPEQVAQRDLHYVKYHFTLDGNDHVDDLGQSLSYEDFYRALAAGSVSKTSRVTTQEYVDYFESLLAEYNKDILHLAFSSGLSGSAESASIAAGQVTVKHPERKIYVVDSLAASSGYGLFVLTLADMRDEGASIDELRDWAEQHKLELHHWFFSGDLTTYIRGGRVSKTAGFIGNVLGICPVLNVDYMGRLIPRAKVLSKKKAVKDLVGRMAEHARDGENYSGNVMISHSNCLEDAQAVEALIRERFPNVKSIIINMIGFTIGSHAGNGTVALFFWGDKRVD